MRLSTKGRYAVTAMMELALRSLDKPVTLDDIASTQGISSAYLEQLFRLLSKHQLVKGIRGPNGGYRLARSANDISIAQIIVAVDEKIDSTRCEGKANCQGGERCLTHELWEELSDRLFTFLDSVSLGYYINRPDTRSLIARSS
ncbi:MAG: Rrf2 family transcriptional regulator [Gammaproteobacteria bacterium]|nr:Rrf2 family transcriptional regulator [Gammaproteobacteria bacterium]